MFDPEVAAALGDVEFSLDEIFSEAAAKEINQRRLKSDKQKEYWAGLSEDERVAQRTRMSGWYRENIEYVKKQNQQYQSVNAHKIRCRRRGLTPEEYSAIWDSQGQRCAICKRLESAGCNQYDSEYWHVDHCHLTDKVRGILCHGCNMMLGGSRDNLETLAAGIKYLEASRGA